SVERKQAAAQQSAPPSEVYAQPANLAVARFMGYRNVLDLDVDGEAGDKVTLSGRDIRIMGPRRMPLAGKRAAVACRPEEAGLIEPGLATNAIAGRVVNVEYGG